MHSFKSNAKNSFSYVDYMKCVLVLLEMRFNSTESYVYFQKYGKWRHQSIFHEEEEKVIVTSFPIPHNILKIKLYLKFNLI